MKRIILFFLIFVPLVHSAQLVINGTVTDAKDKKTLPYVNVYVKNSTQGTYTNVKGKFTIKVPQNKVVLVFSSIGYTKQDIIVTKSSTIKIALQPLVLSLEETIVLPGENPADIIMRKVVDNRNIHNPEKLKTFRYKSYNKFVVNLNKRSLKNFNSDSINLNDSVALAKRDSTLRNKEKTFEDTLLNEMNLFLMESVTEKKYKRPKKYKETVLASRIAGVKNAQYVLLANEFQAFSFYNNYIKVMGKEYLSPITKGNTKKYLFILQDTAEEAGESVFVIYYQPRKGKNFDGLTGLLYVNKKNFALMKVTASIADKSQGVSTQVVQQYKKLNGKVYFPIQFTAEFNFTAIAVTFSSGSEGMREYSPFGRAKTILYDINLDNNFKNRDFDNIELSYAPDALKKDTSFWNKNRQEELTNKDSLTYTIIDSIGKKLKLDRRLQLFRMLQTRQLPVGTVNIHIEDILRFNNFEGVRLGLHLSTNERLSRRFKIGGYYAYGFNDKRSKYGGDFHLYFNKTQSAALNVSYSNDVAETGEHTPLLYKLQDNELGRTLYISMMDRVERSKASVNFKLLQYISIDGGLETVNKSVTTAYLFGDGLQQAYRFTNAVASLRWAPREKLIESFGRYTPKKRHRSFVMHATITKGINNLLNSEFDFLRTDIMADYKFRIHNMGNTHIRLAAGLVNGQVPITEMYFGRAGYNDKNISLVTPFAFETMRFNEFSGNEYAALFFRHDFASLLYKTKKWKPQILLITNIYISKLSNPLLHKVLPLQPANKGFYESGVQVNNIFNINFSGYGLGIFYRYGAYSNIDVAKNIAIKLSFSFAF